MHSVAFVDLLTLLSLIGTLIAFGLSMYGQKSQDSFKRLTISFLSFSILYYVLLYMEWASSDPTFDRLEDFAGVLVPMWWGGLFYGIMQIISNRELVISQHRYQMLVDNIDELIIRLDDNNRIHFASPSFCALIEKSAEELIGREFFSVMAVGDNSSEFDFVDQARKPPFTIDCETPVATRAGVRWFTWNAKRISDDPGNEKSILVLGRDISENKKAEQSLQESETRHRQFIDNQPVGMFRTIIEGDGRFVVANPAMVQMFGYPTVESFLNTPVVDLYRDPQLRQEVLERLLREGKIYGMEREGKRRDGEPFIFSLTLQLIRDGLGNPLYVDGTIIDITEHKQAEMRLKKSEELHREAQQIAHLGHWERKLGDDSLIWSDEMYRIFEFEKRSSGVSFVDLFLERMHPEDRTRVDEHVHHAIENRTGIDIINRVLFPDGRVKHVHAMGNVEYDDNGNPVRLVGTVQDVTNLREAEIERERSEQKLLQAQKMEAIGTLAGGIAHDFNNILASIIGFTELSIAELPKDNKSREYLEQVLQAGLRARDLVSHILSFSRQGENRLETIQVQIIIKEVAKFLRASIPANIEINQKISSHCCPVLADPTQIHQIIMNLCTNSYHAIGNRKGRITISLEEAEIEPHDFPEMPDVLIGRHVKLVVSDTGQGMDQATLGKIFDPYFTTKKKGEGTGLGLSVVHGIVKKHGGHINAYSEPGHGTSFTIFLPCATDQQTINQKEATAEVHGGNEHILIVDDEKPLTDLLTIMLNRRGYRVMAFNDADQAIGFCQSQPEAFDLIITDMNMPKMSGEEFARLIHKISPQVPVIIQTGFSEDLDVDRLQHIGVRAIMNKPVIGKEMAHCIRNVIDKKNE